MSSHVFIVDGVGHRGDVRSLVRSIDSHLLPYPESMTVWVARPDQAPFLTAQQIIGQASDSLNYESSIDQWIVGASQNGHAGSVFHVMSYNPKVLAKAVALNNATRVVVTEHLGKIRDSGYIARPAGASMGSPTVDGASLTHAEAIALMKRVLRDGGHTSSATAMHQAQLRLAMSRVDPRARKDPSDPTTWNLIRDLVKQGQDDGWLHQERRGSSGYEYLWMAESSPVDAVAAKPVPNATPLDFQPAEQPPLTKKPERRDVAFEEVLRAERIGSPPIPRKYVFDAADAVIRETAQEPLTVAGLIGRVCERARKMAAEAGYTKDQHWGAICECVFRAMLQAKVLLMTDGTPVPAKIGQHSSKAAKLADNFRQRTEALMLERIIQKRGDVTLADTYPLGLALYQQGRENAVSREDMLARIDALQLLLQAEERVDVKADDVLVASY